MQKHPREKFETLQQIYAHTQDHAKKPVKVIVFYRGFKTAKTNFSLALEAPEITENKNNLPEDELRGLLMPLFVQTFWAYNVKRSFLLISPELEFHSALILKANVFIEGVRV